MEVVTDYEFLTGNHNNDVILKELSVAADGIVQTFHFQSPYCMLPQGSAENALNRDDRHIPYYQLS
jgi:hypothetical protein